mgnify:CR=1 FL=1
MEIEETDSKVLEVLTPESEHWRGLQPDPTDRLLIRRSLVRAQVEEPIKSKGYVARRNPFSICDIGKRLRQLREFALTHRDSATVLGPSTERREPASRLAPRRRVRRSMSACGCGAKGQAFAAFDS